MKILYVTIDYPGFSECIFEGADYPYGLPSFNNVLLKLIEEGHVVNFVLMQNKMKKATFNIGYKQFTEEQFKLVLYTGMTRFSNLKFRFELIFKLNKLLKQEHYDFIYCHGISGALASIPAKLNNVKFGQRIYGTFLWESIEKKGLFLTIIKNWQEIYAFNSKKDFLLVTNDGSKGDKVFEKIVKRKNRFIFKFLINGIDKNVYEKATDENKIDKNYEISNLKPYLFSCARFDSWKRQDRVVEILRELVTKGYNINLIFAGPKILYNNKTDYYDSVMEKVKSYDLGERVHYMGNISYDQIKVLNEGALAALILHDTCNMTNVFHESRASGAIVITEDDGVVSNIIESGEDGFIVQGNEGAVNVLIDILEGRINTSLIKEKSKENYLKKMSSWEERIHEEIMLIKSVLD